MKLSFWLLKLFFRELKQETGLLYFRHRYQALSIIWLNLLSLLCILWFFVLNYLPYTIYNDYILAVIGLANIVSLISLKRGNEELAAGIMLASFHIGLTMGGVLFGNNISFMLFIPSLIYKGHLVTASKRILFINMIGSILQTCIHVYMLSSTYRSQYLTDYDSEISLFKLMIFPVVIEALILCYSMKTADENIQEILQSNLEKTENITKELVESIETKSIFLSSFSHEIRNSLNAMNASIDYLLATIQEIGHLEVLRNAKLAGEMALNFVNNMLDFSKLRAEKLEINLVDTNPSELLKRVIGINQEHMKRRELCCLAFISKNMPTTLKIDSARIVQILMNLFSNSIKHTKKHGKIILFMSWCGLADKDNLLNPFPESIFLLNDNEKEEININSENSISMSNTRIEKRLSECDIGSLLENSPHPTEILKKKKTLLDVNEMNKFISKQFRAIDSVSTPSTVRSERSYYKGYLKFEISDTGCGIAPEDIEKLFAVFPQIKNSRADPSYRGTSLGLWICKQLILKMGGDIKAYSKINQGTTFVFYIPADNTPMSPEVREIYTYPREALRALVVDDYDYNRNVHKLILEREGVEVSLASNGKDALEKFLNKPEGYFDFIMMDIMMPEMDGITAAKEIRKYEKLHRKKQQVDIYFVSAKYDLQDPNEELELKGTNAKTLFLPKPLDLGMVKKLIEKFSKKRAMTQVDLFRKVPTSPRRMRREEIVGSKASQVQRTLNLLLK